MLNGSFCINYYSSLLLVSGERRVCIPTRLCMALTSLFQTLLGPRGRFTRRQDLFFLSVPCSGLGDYTILSWSVSQSLAVPVSPASGMRLALLSWENSSGASPWSRLILILLEMCWPLGQSLSGNPHLPLTNFLLASLRPLFSESTTLQGACPMPSSVFHKSMVRSLLCPLWSCFP